MSEHDELTRRLREHFRDARIESDAQTDERVHALLRGELSEDDAMAVASTLLDDSAAALEARVSAAMEAALAEEQAELSEDAAAEPVVLRPRRSRWAWSVVGALAAALVAFWIVRPPRLEPVDPGTIRQGASVGLESKLGSGPLPRTAFDLVWTPGPAGCAYDVYITTPELRRVHQVLDLEQPRYRVPAEALVDQSPGARLLWRVVATDEDGRRLHSATFEVVVQ